MLGFQSLLLSLLSCVCCFFCWRVNDNGSILIPQQVDHSNIFHMTESLHPKAVAPFFCHNAVNFRCGDWICPFYQIWVADFFPSQLSWNHVVHLISCWMLLLNSCNHSWRLVEVYVLSFLWQQPGGVRNVAFIPSCYMTHSLKVRKIGPCSPLQVFRSKNPFVPRFSWLVSLTFQSCKAWQFPNRLPSLKLAKTPLKINLP